MKSHKHQKGAAIILALIAVIIIASIASTLMMRQAINIKESLLVQDMQTAYFQSQKMQIIEEQALINNIKTSQADKLTDSFPMNFGPEAIPGGTLSGEIIDMQSRFNINNLYNAEMIPGFVQLLEAADPSLDNNTAQDIAISTHNWIIGNNTDKNYYAHQNPPYQPGNQAMASISELRLVKGMTPKIYKKIKQYLTALPEYNSSINVNTASLPVILSLGNAVTPEMAQGVIDQRPITANQLFNLPLKTVSIQGIITNTSDYFLSRAFVMLHGEKLVLSTLLKRTQINGKTRMIILWQSKGPL